ncbi:MAG: hypothetical protein ACXWYM_00030 [Candidatus Binatia bacterium]
MSHFAVMVVSDNADEVAGLLQPYHEFECTGTIDEHVVEVDETEEYRESFETAMSKFVVSPQGERIDLYDNRFWKKEPIGGSNGLLTNNVKVIPDGWQEVELPSKEVETFRAYVKDESSCPEVLPGEEIDRDGDHKWGFTEIDADGNVVRTIRRTNPNSKWDWWQVGGRYSGLLRVKLGAFALKGEPGVMGSRFSNAGVDQCKKGELDIPAMIEENRRRVRERRESAFEAAMKRCEEAMHKDGLVGYLGAEFMLDLPRDEAFKEWDALSVRNAAALKRMKAGHDLRGNGRPFWKFIDDERVAGDPDAHTIRLSGYLGYENILGIDSGETMGEALANVKALVTFAVIKDGEWFERGNMGWWGAVSNEDDDWDQRFAELLDAIPDDKLITIVDCHI